MDWTPLASSWAKFHRADAHVGALKTELVRIQRDADAFATDRRYKGREVALVVTRVPDMREAGLILGDAVNCYRAALDHLVWDLVKMGSHPTLGERQAKQVQYPLAKNFVAFTDERGRRAPGISDVAWRLIRSYQPYRNDDRGRAMRLLRDLSDKDKHRFINPAFYTATDYRGRIMLVNCQASSIWQRPPGGSSLNVGVKLARVRVVSMPPNGDVDFETQLTMEPSINRGAPLAPALGSIREAAFAILSRFEAIL